MKAEHILDGILSVIAGNLKELAEAHQTDSEINYGGNGYNESEAGGYFRFFVEEINEILPDDLKLEFPSLDEEEEEPKEEEDEQ